MKEVIFSNLPDIAENKNVISEIYEYDKWKTIPYKTKLCTGTMLVAGQDSKPEPVILNINLKGWYRIFISTMNMRSESYSYIKLSDDTAYTLFKCTTRPPVQWCHTECVEELYWKSADLTDQKIVISPVTHIFNNITSLLWIRCEEMTEAEIQEEMNLRNSNKNRCLQTHYDMDLYSENLLKEDSDHMSRFHVQENSNVEFSTMEISYAYDRHENKNNAALLKIDRKRTEYDYKNIEKIEKQYKDQIDFSHKNNFEIFCGLRMCVGSFFTPYCLPGWNKNFAQNQQFCFVNRDLSTTTILSFAFEEVQNYVLNNILHYVNLGFDGVTMIYHRGAYIGFEKPVIDLFKSRYPDVDPYLLPLKDERLCSVRCELMTGFMKKVRETLDKTYSKHIKVNVIGEFGLETAKYNGLDIETWAKQGLVDCVSQSDMELYEDLTDCMSDENPELIDMEKYKKRILDFPVIRRNFGSIMDKIYSHGKEYAELEDKYGVKVYHVLPWIHSFDYSQYDEIIENMKKNHAKRFFSWNTDHLIWDMPEWYVVSHIGNERNDKITLRRFYRTLSLDNNDVSHINPNWMG